MISVCVGLLALAGAPAAFGQHDLRPDPLRGRSHVAEYRYLLETMQVTRLTRLSPVAVPAVPLNLLVDIRVRVRTRNNQHSFFVIPYSRGEVEKYSFGDLIYLHEHCTPDERPTYFTRARFCSTRLPASAPRDFPLPANLKTGGLVLSTNQESARLKPELDKLLHDGQAIVVGELDRVLDPEAQHDMLGTNRPGLHVQWTIRPSCLVSGTL